MNALLDWAREAGAQFPRLEVRSAGGLRGVYARAPIGRGEIVLRIPLRCIVTADRVERSGIDPQLASEQARFAAFLLRERRNNDSWWKPYIAALPRTFPDSPLFFGAEELAWLKGSHSLELIKKTRQRLRDDYECLRDSLPGFGSFSYAEFMWAKVSVTTRIFSLEIDGKVTQGMVPIADLMNHRTPKEVDYAFNDRTRTFDMKSLTAFGRGDAVRDSYGSKCNSRFFVHYGFALPENEANQASVSVPSPAEGHELFRRLADGPPGGACRFRVSKDLGSAACLMSFLRLLSADGHETRALPPNLDEGTGTDVPPISRRNEAAALDALSDVCTRALAAFDTTLAEDEALLLSPALSTNLRNAVIVRRGEKKVLQFYQRLAMESIPIVRLPRAQRSRAIRALPADSAPFAGYLKAVHDALKD